MEITHIFKWIKMCFLPKLPSWFACNIGYLGEGKESFLQLLIQPEKIMLGFDFSSLSSEGFIAWSPFFTACLNSACSSRANFGLIFFKQFRRWPRSSAASFSSKMWFYLLRAQIIYLAFITHCFVVLVVSFCLCFPCA